MSSSSSLGKDSPPLRTDTTEATTRTSEDPLDQPVDLKLKEGSASDNSLLPMSVIRALRRKTSSLGGSLGNGSSNGGSGNNSDNSGLVSIGNGSFGFNFDTDDLNASRLLGSGSDGDGSDGNSPSDRQGDKSPSSEGDALSDKSNEDKTSSNEGTSSDSGQASGLGQSTVSSLTGSDTQAEPSSSHEAAAAKAVANLHTIAAASTLRGKPKGDVKASPKPKPAQRKQSRTRKRPAPDKEAENDSAGYNSDGEMSVASDNKTEQASSNAQMALANSMVASMNAMAASIPSEMPAAMPTAMSVPSSACVTLETSDPSKRPKKKKKLDEGKREERNQREKERSFRISKQINELRGLLSNGGVIVPKGTKSSVLSEAANYIRMLQQHQYRSEIDRHQLVQQMQMIGGGTLGPQAAGAVRHVAAQNGVWSLGNFGGVPPKSAMTYYQGSSSDSTKSQDQATSPLSASIDEHEYRFVFNSGPVGMAIASMGGAFIDCNTLFCQLSNYTKQEVCSMTIFNMTSRDDLQPAFDLISQMISPPSDARAGEERPTPCVLRGSMKNRQDLGLSVSLIRGDDKIAKCFCVTLIKNPTSPFDTAKPIPATAEFIQPQVASTKDGSGPLNASHAYTTG